MINMEITHPMDQVRSAGGQNFTLTAGQILKIETTPNGEVLLERTVPRGKVRVYSISISEIETDA